MGDDARLRVLDAAAAEDRAEWLALWQQWPQREVFAHPAYVALYATGDAVRARCAVWEAGDGAILYPFLLRDLTGEPFWTPAVGPAADLITPYGYGGPFAWGGAASEAGTFWIAFDAWCAARGVVSEFIRFALFPEELAPYPGERTHVSDNIVRSLALGEDEIWSDFAHKVRKNVNKAERSGVRIEVDTTGERLDEFLGIYRHTMERNDASQQYLFSPTFFRTIHEALPGSFAYFHALHGDQVVSTELVLMSADQVYSFLGGTLAEAFPLRPNDLLKHRAVLWARAQGKLGFVLGGGYRPDDGIFRYKLSFAPTGVVPFFVGRRVLVPETYRLLVQNRPDTRPPAPGFFPAYRA